MAIYHGRREKLVALADQHRGKLKPVEYVRFLIQAAIMTGITERSLILDAVELAANREAVARSIETDAEYESIPTVFTAAYIKNILMRGCGRQPGRDLWWVDGEKIYHLN